jgi:hypothetical protein
MANENEEQQQVEAAEPVAVYQERIPSVEAIRFDGKNGDDVLKFIGKKYGKKIGDDALELRVLGEHPQSPKLSVSVGQWVLKQPTGSPVTVVNDGDFKGQYEKTDKEPTPPPPEPEEQPPPQPPEGEVQAPPQQEEPAPTY